LWLLPNPRAWKIFWNMPKEVISLNKWPFLDTMNTFLEPVSMRWGLCTGRLPSIWCQANLWTLSHSQDERAIVWHWGSCLCAMHSVPTVVAELAADRLMLQGLACINNQVSASAMMVDMLEWGHRQHREHVRCIVDTYEKYQAIAVTSGVGYKSGLLHKRSKYQSKSFSIQGVVSLCLASLAIDLKHSGMLYGVLVFWSYSILA
jgi:hypothetical protein